VKNNMIDQKVGGVANATFKKPVCPCEVMLHNIVPLGALIKKIVVTYVVY